MFLFRVVTWIIPHPKIFIRRQLVCATVSLFELLLLLNFFLFFLHIRKVLNCYKCLFVVLMLQNYDFFFESEEPKREKCRLKRENSPFSPFWLKRCGKKGCHACNGVTLCSPTLGFHIYIAYAVVLNLRAVAPLAKGCHSVCRLPLQYPHSAVVVDGEGVG